MLDNPLTDRAVLAGHREWFGVQVKALAFFNFLVDFFVAAMFFPLPLSDCPHGRSRVDNRQIRGQCTVTRGRKIISVGMWGMQWPDFLDAPG